MARLMLQQLWGRDNIFKTTHPKPILIRAISSQKHLDSSSSDKHQYLLHSSCHPIRTKRAIPFSLALRLRRICSTNETFTLRTNELIEYLYKRGYNRYFLQREIQRVNNITRTEALIKPHDTSTLDKPKRFPLVITYNPALRSISSIIRKHFHILFIPHCYNFFKSAPIVAYRRSSNLCQ